MRLVKARRTDEPSCISTGGVRATRLTQNVTAWALASAWRGIALYPVHGPVMGTGRGHVGGVVGLYDDLTQHARLRRPCG